MEYNLSDFQHQLKKLADYDAYVYLKNWDAGFGSALVCLIDNIVAFNKYKITVIPLWINNTSWFDYKIMKTNFFYEFFDDNYTPPEKYDDFAKIIINSNVPVLSGGNLTSTYDDLSIQSQAFKKRFKIKEKYYKLFDSLAGSLPFTFSIHFRSNYQKAVHYDNNIINLHSVCKSLQNKYGRDCVPFIATDVTDYLNIFLSYFPKAVYNASSFRAPTDRTDSAPLIQKPDMKHGEDIILDLIGLSRGEIVYMSESNFYLMVRYIFDDNLPVINMRLLK